LKGLPEGENPMRSTFRSFLFIVALVASRALSEAQAQETHDWITRELDARDYKLSSYEENGVYYCSIGDQKIIDTQFENGYVQIIFEHAAPRFFLEKEIAPDLLGKLRAIEIGQFYSVLCIHSFFRDDWQEHYDAEHTVSARLLNIRKKQDKEFVAIQ
jgi:hypothetical protein